MRGRIRHYYKIALRAMIYAFLRPVIEIFRLLPPASSARTGALLGTALFLLLYPRLGRARRNVGRAFPDADRRTRDRILLGSFRHLGFVLGQYLSLTFRDPARVKGTVEVEGFEPIERACAIGRGVVILTAHMGSWELAAAAVATRVPRVAAVARELYDKRLDRLSKRLRARFGVRTIDTRDLRGMLRLLRAGGVLGVLADQSSLRVTNVSVPFFDGLVPTPEGPVRLAHQTGSLLANGFILRTGDTYRLKFEVLSDDPAGVPPAEVLSLYNRRLERRVRSFPEQWLWLHDRWRHAGVSA